VLGERPDHQKKVEGSIVISCGLNSVKRQLEMRNETNLSYSLELKQFTCIGLNIERLVNWMSNTERLANSG